MPALKLLGAALFAALGIGLADGDPVRIVLGLVVAAGLIIWASRDLLLPVRLTADHTGVTVPHGLTGRRRLAWSQVEHIRLDTRPRLGLRSVILEIDTGEALYLFGRYDLDAPPSVVAAALRELRAAAR
jgi:hypothetical protein